MKTSCESMDVIEMDVIKEESSKSETKCSLERPSSPSDCAICLEQLKDKSFTDSCLHMFCFHCLEAWSRVKAECPLCKQNFCSIIHNIRSMTDYDEYHVPPPVEARLSVTPPFVSPREIAEDYFAHDFFSNRRRFFSYRTTLMPNTYTIPRVRSSNLVIQPYIDNLELEGNFSRLNSTQSSISRCNRAEIYARELETRPPSTGRYRESSPEFYRANETQLHRLARWINRELLALSQIGVRFIVHEIQQMVMDLLVLYSINSALFHNILRPYLGVHTTRFIRELYQFATSPYEMDQYDRECVHLRRRSGSQLSFIVTVGRDDTEDVQVLPSTSFEQPVRSWIDVNQLNPSRFETSSNISSASRPFNNDLFHCGRATTSAYNSPNVSNSVINLADSDNDDCVILDNAAAPETIVLDDSNDEAVNPSSPIPTRLPPVHIDTFSSSNRPLDLSTLRELNSPSSPCTCLPPPTETGFITSQSESKPTWPETETKLSAASSFRTRSNSDSSVLSTCISSDESDYVRKSKRIGMDRACKAKVRRQTRRKFSSNVFSSEYSAESTPSDSDGEASRRKRKKKSKKNHTSKREKKQSSKKRKKLTERKSKRKKVDGSSTIVDSDRVPGKSHQKVSTKNKVHRFRDVRQSVIQSPRSSVGKLCSVLKVVHRENDFDIASDQPSTSSGYRGRHNFMNFNRSHVFLSDSD